MFICIYIYIYIYSAEVSFVCASSESKLVPDESPAPNPPIQLQLALSVLYLIPSNFGSSFFVLFAILRLAPRSIIWAFAVPPKLVGQPKIKHHEMFHA